MNFIKKTKSFIERTIQYDSIFLKFQKQAKIFVFSGCINTWSSYKSGGAYTDKPVFNETDSLNPCTAAIDLSILHTP